MAILKIAAMGHPVLMAVAKPIEDPSAPEIRKLAADMIDTMRDADGAGLAAPQVHVPLRLVIFRAPGEEEEDEHFVETAPLTVLINPEIEILSPDTESGWEGCLSLPSLRGLVTRASHIRYAGFDLEGKRFIREAKGFHARVVQHECDHLDGILYPQRMTDMRQFLFESEMRHWQKPEDE